MGWLEAFDNYYRKKQTRRNSWPFTSRQRLEFTYFYENHFGYSSLWNPPRTLPLQMRLLRDH